MENGRHSLLHFFVWTGIFSRCFQSLVFEAIYFPMDASVSEGAEYSLGQLTFDEASTFPAQTKLCHVCTLSVHRKSISSGGHPSHGQCVHLSCRYLQHNRKIGDVILTQQR